MENNEVLEHGNPEDEQAHHMEHLEQEVMQHDGEAEMMDDRDDDDDDEDMAGNTNYTPEDIEGMRGRKKLREVCKALMSEVCRSMGMYSDNNNNT